MAPIARADVFDDTSPFWTAGPTRFWQSIVDRYCDWQSHLQERLLIQTDLRIIYAHAKQDTQALTGFLQNESNYGDVPLRHVKATLALCTKKIDIIGCFFQSQNIPIEL